MFHFFIDLDNFALDSDSHREDFVHALHQTVARVNHRISWFRPLLASQGSDRESAWRASSFTDGENVRDLFAVRLALSDHFKEALDATRA
jgi:hypothetical protein